MLTLAQEVTTERTQLQELRDYHHHPQLHHTLAAPPGWEGCSLLEEQARPAHRCLEGLSTESPKAKALGEKEGGR